MFLVIFLWSPPHFWALAIWKKEEYARAGIPMLPVAAGEQKTCKQIMFYTAGLVPVTFCLGLRAELGWLFFIGAALLGMNLIRKSVRLGRRKDPVAAKDLFRYSIIYLAAVFALTVLSG
jgi:protoheme IX farnesyltransferase